MSFIIDTHTHFNSAQDNPLPVEILLIAMKENRINFALTSNLAGCEFDSWHRPRPSATNQVETNRQTAQVIKKKPAQLGGIYWIKPNENKTTLAGMELILENPGIFYALKFHPYYSAVKVTDPVCTPWFEFAVAHRLPVVIHTDWDEWSHPEFAATRAAQFPELNIVMIHMGLWGGPELPLELMERHPNLYGDLTWLRLKNVQKILLHGDLSRIMLGSDAIIAGEDSYLRCRRAVSEIKKLPEQTAQALLFQTAQRVFKLPADLLQLQPDTKAD